MGTVKEVAYAWAATRPSRRSGIVAVGIPAFGISMITGPSSATGPSRRQQGGLDNNGLRPGLLSHVSYSFPSVLARHDARPQTATFPPPAVSLPA